MLLTFDKRRKKWYRDATRTNERRKRPGRPDPGGRAATSTPAAQAATHKPDRATGTSRTAGPHKPGGGAATTRMSSGAHAPRRRPTTTREDETRHAATSGRSPGTADDHDEQPPRAATTTRRTATHKRRRERKESQPRRHKRQTSPRPGKASGMHLDNCTTPRLPPRGTNEAAEWRNADGITLGAAGTRNAPERRGGTQLPGLPRRDRQGGGDSTPRKAKHLTRHAAQAAVFPDARTLGRRERPKTATKRKGRKK